MADAGHLDVMGVDIGTINLALCRMQMCNGQPRIVWWAVIDLLGLDSGIAKDACAAIPKALAPYLAYIADCPLFAIEQQPFYNTTMRMVAHGLLTYFHTVSTVDCATFMSAAQNKLKPFAQAKIDSYEERKASAIKIVAQQLNEQAKLEVPGVREWALWYAALAKRDDAADAWLHCYYALLRQQTKPYQANPTKTLGKLTIKQLQDQLRQRGLPISGTKLELRQRIREAKAAESGKPPTLAALRKKATAAGLDATGTRKELESRLHQLSKKHKSPKKRPNPGLIL